MDAVRSSFTDSHELNPILAAKKLAQLSVQRGSIDDITISIIKLDHFTQA